MDSVKVDMNKKRVTTEMTDRNKWKKNTYCANPI